MRMDHSEKNRLYKDLNECKTIGEVFNYLSNYYDLFSKDIPGIYKALVITSIITAIDWIKPLKK
jgi:hypothetical protein